MITSLRMTLIPGTDHYRVYINDNQYMEMEIGGVIAELECQVRESDPETEKEARKYDKDNHK